MNKKAPKRKRMSATGHTKKKKEAVTEDETISESQE